MRVRGRDDAVRRSGAGLAVKPIPEHADAGYIAAMIVLYVPVEDWKAKLETIPDDKRDAVREELKVYWARRKR